MKKVLAIFLVSLFSLFSAAAPSNSHSALVIAYPAVGADLSELPAEVRLIFNESLLLLGDKNPNELEVVNAADDLVSGKVSVSGPEIIALINNEIAGSGEYLVKYRVVSADGHPVEGEYQFTVASPEVISAPVEEEPEDGSNLLVRLAQTLLVLAGIGIFALLRLRK